MFGAGLCEGAVCVADKSRRAAARVTHEEEVVRLQRQWRDLLRAVTAERGLWGNADSASLHWKLDRSEDPSRRYPPRLDLTINYVGMLFYGINRHVKPVILPYTLLYFIS